MFFFFFFCFVFLVIRFLEPSAVLQARELSVGDCMCEIALRWLVQREDVALKTKTYLQDRGL